MAEKVRVQKFMAAAGVASRRKAEEMISSGRVKVNGRLAKLGDSVDEKHDIVELDGNPIEATNEKLYLALYKPRGFVTTMDDEKNRKCVAQLVQDVGERVYPVGRLDKDSEGLLLFTNDGEFANLITHPRTHVAKTYRVTVRPNVTEDQLARIATGIVIDGKKTAPAKVKELESSEGKSVLEIVLYEGRNREIRKMCEALGLDVARLKRIAVGPVRIGMLKQGKYRELKVEEVKGLFAEANKHKLDDREGEKHVKSNSNGGQRRRKNPARGKGARGR